MRASPAREGSTVARAGTSSATFTVSAGGGSVR
jgi:hypothetical protein